MKGLYKRGSEVALFLLIYGSTYYFMKPTIQPIVNDLNLVLGITSPGFTEDSRKRYIDTLNQFAEKNRSSTRNYQTALDLMLKMAQHEVQEDIRVGKFRNLEDIPDFDRG